MTRDDIVQKILLICKNEFEIEDPDLNDDLREKYAFDSIDAIELLLQIEAMLNSELTQEEKKRAMEIRSINQICDYVELLLEARIPVAEQAI